MDDPICLVAWRGVSVKCIYEAQVYVYVCHVELHFVKIRYVELYLSKEDGDDADTSLPT